MPEILYGGRRVCPRTAPPGGGEEISLGRFLRGRKYYTEGIYYDTGNSQNETASATFSAASRFVSLHMGHGFKPRPWCLINLDSACSPRVCLWPKSSAVSHSFSHSTRSATSKMSGAFSAHCSCLVLSYQLPHLLHLNLCHSRSQFSAFPHHGLVKVLQPFHTYNSYISPDR